MGHAWSRQVRIIAKMGSGWYRFVLVGASVRMERELPQTICLVLSKRKLTEVAVYSPVCSRCCRKKAAYSRLLWERVGI